MNPEDVPEELDGIAKEAWNRHAATAPPGAYHHEGIRRAIVAAVMPEIERRTREQVRKELFGTPEEIAAREAEAAQRTPDDTVRLCEMARPGEHERRVREQVAAEIEETATFDAARAQADNEIGHERTCEWHDNGGAYCSCKVWPAACAGVSVTALRVRGEGR